ncbi:MAG: hypothetical protein FWC66_10165, partial [Oscillospiraceae bacterium]|nr:hypothetical protein [Oscillospiraceae bacterium]
QNPMLSGSQKMSFLRELKTLMAYKTKFSAIAENDLFEVIGELVRFYPSTPKRFKSALKKALSNIKRKCAARCLCYR